MKKKSGGSFFIKLSKNILEEEIFEIENALKNTPGFSNYYRAFFCKTDIEEIKKTTKNVLEFFLENKNIKTFGVKTKKIEKTDVIGTYNLDCEIGSFVFDYFKKKGSEKKVFLKNPDLKINIKVYNKKTMIFLDKKKSVGGLPVGSIGRAITLLSGGIDSPVSSYLAIKRGLEIVAVHFHSVPKTNKGSIEKVKKIAEKLSKFQKNIKVYLVPIIPLQENIVKNCKRNLSVVLQRRLYFKIAQKVAEIENMGKSKKINTFITGDSLGQVASQTLENLNSANDVFFQSSNFILRPLITFDKTEIKKIATDIGTLKISEISHEDSCSLFVPKNPETMSKILEVRKEEEKIDQKIIENILKKVEIFEV